VGLDESGIAGPTGFSIAASIRVKTAADVSGQRTVTVARGRRAVSPVVQA
jgi:hypothetical protein